MVCILQGSSSLAREEVCENICAWHAHILIHVCYINLFAYSLKAAAHIYSNLGPSILVIHPSSYCLDMSSESIDGEGKGKLDCSGLSSEWEDSRDIRGLLQEEGKVLFAEGVSATVKASCKDHIFALLVPLLSRMASLPGAPQPTVDPLREELAKLYRACNKHKSTDDSDIVHDSWMVRKFLGLVKMKVRIRKPSTVIWMQCSM